MPIFGQISRKICAGFAKKKKKRLNDYQVRNRTYDTITIYWRDVHSFIATALPSMRYFNDRFTHFNHIRSWMIAVKFVPFEMHRSFDKRPRYAALVDHPLIPSLNFLKSLELKQLLCWSAPIGFHPNGAPMQSVGWSLTPAAQTFQRWDYFAANANCEECTRNDHKSNIKLIYDFKLSLTLWQISMNILNIFVKLSRNFMSIDVYN